MRYRGTLLPDGESDAGLRVILEADDSTLSLTSMTGERLGSWHLLEVEVERAEADRFTLTLGGEALLFAADDRLGFAYTGAPSLERQRTKLGKGWRGRRAAKRLADSPTPSVATGPATPDPRRDERQPTAVDAPDMVARSDPPTAAPAPPPASPPAERNDAAVTPVEPAADPEPPKASEPEPVPEPVDHQADEPPVELPQGTPAPPALADPGRPTPRPIDAAASSGADPYDTEVVIDLAADAEPPDLPAMPPRTKLGILDRVRRSKVEHEHEYRTSSLAGGLVRRVCVGCNQVSIEAAPEPVSDTIHLFE